MYTQLTDQWLGKYGENTWQLNGILTWYWRDKNSLPLRTSKQKSSSSCWWEPPHMTVLLLPHTNSKAEVWERMQSSNIVTAGQDRKFLSWHIKDKEEKDHISAEMSQPGSSTWTSLMTFTLFIHWLWLFPHSYQIPLSVKHCLWHCIQLTV